MNKRITFSMDSETIDKLREVSKETMIPQSRLVEEALKEIIKKYEK